VRTGRDPGQPCAFRCRPDFCPSFCPLFKYLNLHLLSFRLQLDVRVHTSSTSFTMLSVNAHPVCTFTLSAALYLAACWEYLPQGGYCHILLSPRLCRLVEWQFLLVRTEGWEPYNPYYGNPYHGESYIHCKHHDLLM
jgi:hypothetical protein